MADSQRELRFTDEFERQSKRLAKRYRQLRKDLEPVLEQLQSGKIMGDRITGIPYAVYKVRLKNSDLQKGKSGGYRLIYQLDSASLTVLLLIYTKSDRDNVTAKEIEAVVERFRRA